MDDLYKLFPRLQRSHCRRTSRRTKRYNCPAWAAGDNDVWWGPDQYSYWPRGVPRQRTLSAFIAAYHTLGYIECASTEYEKGLEKIAIYVNESDQPVHVARQLRDGIWTSKCGTLEDIEHTLEGLEGKEYGSVKCVMKRTRSSGRYQ